MSKKVNLAVCRLEILNRNSNTHCLVFRKISAFIVYRQQIISYLQIKYKFICELMAFVTRQQRFLTHLEFLI